MLEIHLHPDNVVIIRENGVAIYIDTKENFELDAALSLDVLPEGFNERIYVQNVMDRFGDGKTQVTTENSWSQGDSILANRAAIIAAKQVRIG